MASTRNWEAEILTTDADKRGSGTFQMRALRAATGEAQTRRGALRAATTKSRNSETQKGPLNEEMFAYVRLCSPMFALTGKKMLRRWMVNAVRSCKMHDKRRWGLVELAPPSTRGNVWRGRTSISVERVGSRDMLNG